MTGLGRFRKHRNEEVRGLAELLVREKVMPGPVGGDAVHVAFATVHAVDYVLTWNVRHLANPSKLAHLRTLGSARLEGLFVCRQDNRINRIKDVEQKQAQLI